MPLGVLLSSAAGGCDVDSPPAVVGPSASRRSLCLASACCCPAAARHTPNARQPNQLAQPSLTTLVHTYKLCDSQTQSKRKAHTTPHTTLSEANQPSSLNPAALSLHPAFHIILTPSPCCIYLLHVRCKCVSVEWRHVRVCAPGRRVQPVLRPRFCCCPLSLLVVPFTRALASALALRPRLLSRPALFGRRAAAAVVDRARGWARAQLPLASGPAFALADRHDSSAVRSFSSR